MNLTVKLLKTIGSPYIKKEQYVPTEREIKQLYRHACKNRISYYLLYTLKEKEILPKTLGEVYKEETVRFQRILKAMVKVSKDLEEFGIEHAIYKSIRPYPSTTVDIDIILYGNYEKAYMVLRRRGYSLLGLGPETITLQDPTGTVSIDLYREIAMSRVIYLDKEKLRKYKKKINLLAGEVMTLAPEADILAVVAHSMVKEQVFTLADYYTILHYLKQLNLSKICKLASEIYVRTPLYFTLILASALHQRAHNKPIPVLQSCVVSYNEIRKIRERNIELPMKINVKILTQIFLEKLVKDKRTRKSIAAQVGYLMRISYLKFFMNQLKSHIIRETY